MHPCILERNKKVGGVGVKQQVSPTFPTVWLITSSGWEIGGGYGGVPARKVRAGQILGLSLCPNPFQPSTQGIGHPIPPIYPPKAEVCAPPFSGYGLDQAAVGRVHVAKVHLSAG